MGRMRQKLEKVKWSNDFGFTQDYCLLLRKYSYNIFLVMIFSLLGCSAAGTRDILPPNVAFCCTSSICCIHEFKSQKPTVRCLCHDDFHHKRPKPYLHILRSKYNVIIALSQLTAKYWDWQQRQLSIPDVLLAYHNNHRI